MNKELFETLLFRGESDALDFKRDQYPFQNATDDQKSELLKDILAFANSWRTEAAYIVIGVNEPKDGKKAEPVGISHQLPDSDLQQFVTLKTQRPIRFSYEAFSHGGLQFGIITIPKQDRPFYIHKRFGKVEANAVYLRRGSATAIADMDEVARMGQVTPVGAKRPAFKVVASIKIRAYPTGAKFRLAAKLVNAGTGTAFNVSILLDRSSRNFAEPFKSYWEIKPSPDGRLLVSYQMIHPGSEQTIALWEVGNASVTQEILEKLFRGNSGLAVNEIAAKYEEGIDVSLRLKICARDIEPTFFDVRYSKSELEGFVTKTFDPVT